MTNSVLSQRNPRSPHGSRWPVTPPPDRRLPNHARHRARLLGVIGSEHRSRRRRSAVPALVAAMSVAVLTVGGAVTMQQLGGWEPALPPAANGAPAAAPTPSTSPTQSAEVAPFDVAVRASTPPAEPAPKVRDLSRQETAAFVRACDAMAAEKFLGGFEPVVAIELPAEHRPLVPAAWLVARSGEQFALCVRDGRRTAISAGKFGSAAAKDIPSLFAAVDQRGEGFGLVTVPVTTVTVQPLGGREQQAVVRDGFWFSPLDSQAATAARPGGDAEVDENLIGINPPGTILRGYAADGTVVYDSSVDGPSIQECFTDPDGKKVIVHNGVFEPTPETCRRTLSWQR
jgi:hypothetical protein